MEDSTLVCMGYLCMFAYHTTYTHHIPMKIQIQCRVFNTSKWMRTFVFHLVGHHGIRISATEWFCHMSICQTHHAVDFGIDLVNTVWILKSLRGFLQIGAVKHPFSDCCMDGLHKISRSVQVVLVQYQILLVNPMGNPISFQDFLGTTPLIRVLALGHWKDLRRKPVKCWSDQAHHVEPIWPYVFFTHLGSKVCEA